MAFENMQNKRILLKIGGSIVTDKSSETPSLNAPLMQEYVSLIAEEWNELKGRLVLISGGGSFGHPTVRRAKFQSSLTTSMYSLKTSWVQMFSDVGIKAFPMQITKPEDYQYVHKICDMGILPILTCEYVFNGNNEILISSDLVPSFLANTNTRVIIKTNVNGVLNYKKGETIRAIADQEISEIIRKNIESCDPYDVTGGMGGKLKSLSHVTKKGAQAFIMNGNPTPDSISQYLSHPEQWVTKEPYTLVQSSGYVG